MSSGPGADLHKHLPAGRTQLDVGGLATFRIRSPVQPLGRPMVAIMPLDEGSVLARHGRSAAAQLERHLRAATVFRDEANVQRALRNSDAKARPSGREQTRGTPFHPS